MGKLFKKALLYTFFVHFILFIFFMIGFIVNKKKYGDNYINDGIYFNFLFLQFIPITFVLIFVGLLIYHRGFKKNKFR